MAQNKRKHPRPQIPQDDEKSSLIKQGKNQLAQEVVGFVASSFSGPLPDPETLVQYNDIIPNGAERIMAMAENQSQHRQELEKIAIKTDSRNSLLGIIFALIIGLVTIITGGIVAFAGQAWPGTVLGVGGLGSLVYTFIYGTSQRRQERETKYAAKK